MILPRHAEDQVSLEEQTPVGAIEEPQDEAALNDEALVPIAEPDPIAQEPSESVDAESDGGDDERAETTGEGER